ncbi:hypothetical protein RSAG8_03878, partial [Rhizoctonia solani AG-8 WAC10335]
MFFLSRTHASRVVTRFTRSILIRIPALFKAMHQLEPRLTVLEPTWRLHSTIQPRLFNRVKVHDCTWMTCLRRN